MKILMFGKFPPIQGGVSMRTYWAAHELAQLGYTVHVITNAKEVTPPYRMFMRDEDWARCDGRYGPGSVQVHWTEAYGQRQWHIPEGTPFVSKLASLGLELVHGQSFDLIYSHYVEPYSVAAHLVAQAAGLPHVVRTAGSDVGRLWRLPHFGALYTHIFRSAAAIICGATTARKMVDVGVAQARIALKPDKHANLAELFTPQGRALDVAALREEVLSGGNELQASLFGKFDPSLTYFGVYGKLGKNKGTQSLLAAFARLRSRGIPVGLLAMAHQRPAAVDTFRDYVTTNGLEGCVCQLPFLPHWRVPEFIRRCVAICCLEHDFPIKFHDPIVAREVLTCGGCLVGSAEVVGKMPDAKRLIHGHNCIVVNDVSDIDDLERQLRFVLESPQRTQLIRMRARQYGSDLEADGVDAYWLESILSEVVTAGKQMHRNANRVSMETSLSAPS